MGQGRRPKWPERREMAIVANKGAFPCFTPDFPCYGHKNSLFLNGFKSP